MNAYSRSLLALVLMACLCGGAPPVSPPLRIAQPVATGLNAPSVIRWSPDGAIWVGERTGMILRIVPQTLARDSILQIPDLVAVGDAGLLGMALHPAFPDTPLVYVAYTYRDISDALLTKLVRYRYDGTTLVEPTVLVSGIDASTTDDGGVVAFLPDRTILLATGDAGDATRAQDPESLNGKVLRLNPDGTAPGDNPRIDAPHPYDLIWTVGHRDPRGMVVVGDRVYMVERGTEGRNELNIVERGRNYGWPDVEGFCDAEEACVDTNYRDPIGLTADPGALDYYGVGPIPGWSDRLLMVSPDGQHLRSILLSADGLEYISSQYYFLQTFGRLGSLCISPGGRVYVGTVNRDGHGTPNGSDDAIIEIRETGVPLPTIDGPVATGDFRSGGHVVVHFAVSGSFESSNTFTAQISDARGSFDSPGTIGTLEGTGGGEIVGTIPCGISPGVYRVRVISTAPIVDGLASITKIAIRPKNHPKIVPGGPTTFCDGAGVRLTVRGDFQSVVWSNQVRDSVFTAWQSGTFRAYTVDTLGCRDTAEIVVTVVPYPEKPTVEVDNGLLTSSAAYSYQWYRDGAQIPGATGRQYTVTTAGRYFVVVRNEGGCGTPSDTIQAIPAGVGEETRSGEALSIYPLPSGDRVTIVLDVSKVGTIRGALTDLSGALVREFSEERVEGRYRRDLSLAGLPAGLYRLTIFCGDERWDGAVVKK